jgi:hypothetical protein
MMKAREEQGEVISKEEAEKRFSEKLDKSEFKEEMHNLILSIEFDQFC